MPKEFEILQRGWLGLRGQEGETERFKGAVGNLGTSIILESEWPWCPC